MLQKASPIHDVWPSNGSPAPDLATDTTIAFNRYVKILADRRQISARMRDVLQDAKSAGHATGTIRFAAKVDRLPDEKRKALMREISVAARMFGFKVDEREPEIDPDIRGYVERARSIHLDRSAISRRKRELAEWAAQQGVDFQAIQDLCSSPMARTDDEDGKRTERWARLDRMGTFLGWW